jgi:hypothetical protein
MSDHFDSDDPRTDLTDLYIFSAPGRDDGSVLILDFNPDASALEVAFDPAASYELKIDTDGDLGADVAFHVCFASSANGQAVATVYRSTGAVARGTGAVGEVVIADALVTVGDPARIAESGGYRFFAGLRSDPHFKDPEGLHNGFRFTGHDPIASRNVFGIVLEVPNIALGSHGNAGPIRLWARSMAPVEGTMTQVDQAGRPGINNTFNGPEADRLEFNGTPPTEQLARFGGRFLAFLQSLGYPDAEADRLVPDFLPDILAYDPSKPSGYPNGRRLTDDTADLIIAMLTRGRVTSDRVGPHTDLLDTFPYLGPPHPVRNP